MKKIILLCLVACVSSVSMAQSGDGFIVVSPGADIAFLATALSQNGQYIAGWCGSGEGSALYDVESGEFYYFTGDGGSEMSAVSDDGMMIGYGAIGTTAILGYNPKTGEQIVNNTDYSVWAKACTPDASVIAGEYWDEVSWTTYACYWTKDGACYELPQPDAQEIGFGDDGDYSYQGTEAVGISEDGKIIVGVVWDWHLDGGGLIWRMDDNGEYILDPICKDLVETGYGDRPYYQYQPTAISPNGKYVAMYLMDNGSYTTYMGCYDAETGELATAKYSTSCTPTRIANDGTIVGWTGDQDSQSRNALIWEPESDIMLLSDKYPEITEFKEWDEDQDWNFPVGITPDGRYIAGGGFHYFDEDGDDAFARYASWITDREVYDSTLGIENVRTDANMSSTQNEYFSVDGKRLSIPQKGLNIVNGKKLLVK